LNSRLVVIRRFAIGPLAQWGFVAGALVACLPAFVCSSILFSAVTALRGLISGWRDVGFEVLGQRISFNLVQVLNLSDLLQALTTIAGFGIFGVVILSFGLAAVLGIFGAVVLTALGLFYNATGRVQLELEEVTANE